jgi:hypothetical protein
MGSSSASLVAVALSCATASRTTSPHRAQATTVYLGGAACILLALAVTAALLRSRVGLHYLALDRRGGGSGGGRGRGRGAAGKAKAGLSGGGRGGRGGRGSSDASGEDGAETPASPPICGHDGAVVDDVALALAAEPRFAALCGRRSPATPSRRAGRSLLDPREREGEGEGENAFLGRRVRGGGRGDGRAADGGVSAAIEAAQARLAVSMSLNGDAASRRQENSRRRSWRP